MSSTSKKHRNFVSETMGNKPANKLAGVGDVLGSRLAASGYVEASAVLGQYLVQNKDKGQFQAWMNQTCQANRKQSSDCHKCLDDQPVLINEMPLLADCRYILNKSVDFD